MSKTKILVCTHKKDFCVDSDVFQPIHVGAEFSDLQTDYLKDNTGNNISYKNKNYCELTGHYWAWKNLSDYEYIGLCHYRRYFYSKKTLFSNGFILKNKADINYEELIIDEHTFDHYDIILPIQRKLLWSLRFDYKALHIPEDYEIIRHAVKVLYPDYLNSFDVVMSQNNVSLYNMFVTNKKLFDNYSVWLFSILEYIESNVVISNHPTQARIFGFISEYLLNVYCFHNNLKIKYLPVVFVSESSSLDSVLMQSIKMRIKTIGVKLIYFMSKKMGLFNQW